MWLEVHLKCLRTFSFVSPGLGHVVRSLAPAGYGPGTLPNTQQCTEGSSSDEILPQLWFLMVCGLNENGPHRLPYLNTWSPTGCATWGGLGGVALPEEVWQTLLQVKLPLPAMPTQPRQSLPYGWPWPWCFSTATEREGRQGKVLTLNTWETPDSNCHRVRRQITKKPYLVLQINKSVKIPMSLSIAINTRDSSVRAHTCNPSHQEAEAGRALS